jgi:ankyrin repeat protein
MTPLYYAVSRNMTHLPFAYQQHARDPYYRIAEFLIQRGANVNARTAQWFVGWSPIHWAAEYLNLDMVQLLLSNGATLDAHYQLNQRGNRANLAYAFGIRAQQFINDVA